MTLPPSHADYVIVGGGSAGCVLASRLSEDPASTVILIEAGGDHAPGEEPADIADSFPRAATPAYMWPGLVATRDDGIAPRPFEQARVIGGGSSIMGMLALRGLPGDYEAWADAGAAGWGWADVLPWFRKLERDQDFGGPLHGSGGPVLIRRHRPADWPPFCRAMEAVLNQDGLPTIADLNGETHDGVGSVPMTNSPARRVSAASAYLTPQVRARPNLHILADQAVTQVRFDGRRAVGVRIGRGDAARTIDAGETIVSAGAIHSPALLMASGVGPAGFVVERRGVGQNLQNHPALAVSVVLSSAARQEAAIRPAFQNCVRYSSGRDDCAPGDLFMTILNKTGLHPVGARIGALMLSVYKSYSRGWVRPNPADPLGPPQFSFNLLSDPRDFARQVAALRQALSWLDQPAVKRVASDPFIPSNMALIRRLARDDAMSRTMGHAASALFSLPGPMRRALVRRGGVSLAGLAGDEAALGDIVRRHSVPTGHVVGTCRIGREDDADAVVDIECRVIGVDGLRVVDASVMPSIVRANTNIPVIMIAERMADRIRADRRARPQPAMETAQ
ncbi:GMC family oxidoreductase N-terminal domain-containing protein [Sphingomonas naphthae]|uniref:GMC family oxidoreductase N-terminal domain-containing protein n=1 Tax=Sphingomonas naphthae TaxID=1813468 RepID=A0ABY7TN93_9SPHN|nr:GMC family oxidoreductase N-terminal domain-containing protein [Sphingomonas naphthae]WCT74483.1 GMC family oxidoreductase N-terminal domain-containing protein [Sphingomonas naphthae]